MLLIRCPWCGERSQIEFACHGEAHIVRPADPESLDDSEWGDYLFFRENPKGYHRERWVHVHGCGRWFNALRHTVTDQLIATYKPDDPLPRFPGENQ